MYNACESLTQTKKNTPKNQLSLRINATKLIKHLFKLANKHD